MKFRFPLALVLAVLLFAIVAPAVSAQVADGTYNVNYEVKHASNDNASIADGYFQKPAKVTVKDGVYTVTFTVTGSEMVQSLSSSATTVSVVSEGNGTRTYQFQVKDLSKPLTMDMHITVPPQEGFPGYDQDHSARFVFDTSGLPKAGTNEGTDNNKNTNAVAGDASGEKVDNPKTGEDSSMTLYAILLLASLIGLVAVWKFRPARN